MSASLAGALTFASLTGFGRSVRLAEPLPRQLDRALVALGFGIEEVALAGHRYTPEADIYAALGAERSGSLLRYDVTAARRRLEALVWVETASIARILPDRLQVEIKERSPAAIWEHAGRTALIDRTGRVLAHLTGPGTLALPRLAGAGAPAAAGQLLAALAPYPEILTRLETGRRLGERRWTLELAGGVRLLLPADRTGEALQRLSRHRDLAALLEEGAHTIDLRVDGVIALRQVPATQPAARLGEPVRSAL